MVRLILWHVTAALSSETRLAFAVASRSCDRKRCWLRSTSQLCPGCEGGPAVLACVPSHAVEPSLVVTWLQRFGSNF